MDCKISAADPTSIVAKMTTNKLTYSAAKVLGYTEKFDVKCSNKDSVELKGKKATIDK